MNEVQEASCQGILYHTEHFLSGFILDPSGQLKLCENSWILLMGPITLNLGGE